MGSSDDEHDWFSGDARVESPTILPASLATAPLSPERREQVANTLATYEREIAASVDPRRRAALAYAIGQTHEQELGDERRAIRFYQRAHQSDPTHLPTLRAGQRIFAAAERWHMVLLLVEAELRVHPSIARRVRLLARLADLYLTRFGRADDALAYARQALALAPHDADLARSVAHLAAIAGDHAGAGAILAQAASREAEPVLARGLMLAAAHARWVAGDLTGAQAVLTERLEAAPDDAEALTMLARLHRAAGAWTDYIDVSARLAAGLPAGARARLLTDLARTCAEQLNDQVGALALLERAIRADARAPMALEFLVELRSRHGEWIAAVEALAQLIAITVEGPVRVDRLWQLAQLRLDKLGDEAGAIRALRTLLADAPTWAPAVRMLGRLLAERGDWDGVVALHTAELRAIADVTARAVRYFKIGEVHELRRDDPVAAGAAYRQAVDHNPDYKQAGKALARMLVRLGDWEGYVELLEGEADRALDAEAAVYVLRRVAEVSALNLNNPEKALQTWRRVLSLDPTNLEAARNLARLCARTGRWTALLDANEHELTLLDGAASRLDLLIRSAEVAERALTDLPRAQGYLERALALDPHSLPALQAMSRIARRMRRWHALAELYATEVELTRSAKGQVTLWSALGELRRDHLEDIEGAIAAYEAALAIQGDHLASIRALQRLYAQCGDAAGEARMIEAEVRQVPDAYARATLLDRLGRLRAERLAEPGRAAEAWQAALSEVPDFRRALQGLIDNQTRAGAWAALVKTHQHLAEVATTAEEAAAHWLEVARISEDHLADILTAMDALELVLRLQPRHIGALFSLERLSLAAGRMSDLVGVYGQLLRAVEAPSSRADILCRRGRLHADHLQDEDSALADYLAALDAQPDRREAVIWVEGYAARHGDVERLALVLERRLTISDAPNERQLVLGRAAEVLRRAGRLQEAAHCYETVLQLEPDALVAMRALREIYEALGDVKQVLRLTEAEGRRSLDPRTAASLLVEAGLAREADAADSQRALADYLEALDRNPHDAAALRAVRRRCERDGRWAVLAEALHERAGALEDPRSRAQQLIEVADIHARRLDDFPTALQVLDHAARLDEPPDLEVLRRHGDLLCELGEWRAAAEVYATLCGVCEDAELRRAVVYRLASIYQDKLDDLERAGECLELILDEHPEELEAMPRLAAVYAALGATEQARAVYAEAIRLEADPLRQADLKQALALLETNAGRLAPASALLAQVIDTLPSAIDAATRFAALCVQQGNPNRMQAALRHAIRRVADRPATANRLRRVLADNLPLAGGAPADAITVLEEAIAAAPSDGSLRLAHARLAEQHAAHLSAALASRRWFATQHPFDVDNLQALRAVLTRAGRFDSAYEVARLLVALDAATSADQATVSAGQQHVRRWPTRSITAAEREVARMSGAPRALIEAFQIIHAALPSVFATPDRPTRPAPAALQALVDQIADLLGHPRRPVRLEDRPLGQARPTDEALILSAALPERATDEQAFIIAVQLELIGRGVLPLVRASRAVAEILEALVILQAPPSMFTPDAMQARIEALTPLVAKSDHPKLPAALRALPDLLTPDALVHARQACLVSAGRIATLACGGVMAATRALLAVSPGPPERALGLADLIRWAISEPYPAQRRAVGLAVGP